MSKKSSITKKNSNTKPESERLISKPRRSRKHRRASTKPTAKKAKKNKTRSLIPALQTLQDTNNDNGNTNATNSNNRNDAQSIPLTATPEPPPRERTKKKSKKSKNKSNASKASTSHADALSQVSHPSPSPTQSSVPTTPTKKKTKKLKSQKLTTTPPTSSLTQSSRDTRSNSVAENTVSSKKKKKKKKKKKNAKSDNSTTIDHPIATPIHNTIAPTKKKTKKKKKKKLHSSTPSTPQPSSDISLSTNNNKTKNKPPTPAPSSSTPTPHPSPSPRKKEKSGRKQNHQSPIPSMLPSRQDHAPHPSPPQPSLQNVTPATKKKGKKKSAQSPKPVYTSPSTNNQHPPPSAPQPPTLKQSASKATSQVTKKKSQPSLRPSSKVSPAIKKKGKKQSAQSPEPVNTLPSTYTQNSQSSTQPSTPQQRAGKVTARITKKSQPSPLQPSSEASPAIKKKGKKQSAQSPKPVNTRSSTNTQKSRPSTPQSSTPKQRASKVTAQVTKKKSQQSPLQSSSKVLPAIKKEKKQSAQSSKPVTTRPSNTIQNTRPATAEPSATQQCASKITVQVTKKKSQASPLQPLSNVSPAIKKEKKQSVKPPRSANACPSTSAENPRSSTPKQCANNVTPKITKKKTWSSPGKPSSNAALASKTKGKEHSAQFPKSRNASPSISIQNRRPTAPQHCLDKVTPQISKKRKNKTQQTSVQVLSNPIISPSTQELGAAQADDLRSKHSSIAVMQLKNLNDNQQLQLQVNKVPTSTQDQTRMTKPKEIEVSQNSATPRRSARLQQLRLERAARSVLPPLAASRCASDTQNPPPARSSNLGTAKRITPTKRPAAQSPSPAKEGNAKTQQNQPRKRAKKNEKSLTKATSKNKCGSDGRTLQSTQPVQQGSTSHVIQYSNCGQEEPLASSNGNGHGDPYHTGPEGSLPDAGAPLMSASPILRNCYHRHAVSYTPTGIIWHLPPPQFIGNLSEHAYDRRTAYPNHPNPYHMASPTHPYQRQRPQRPDSRPCDWHTVRERGPWRAQPRMGNSRMLNNAEVSDRHHPRTATQRHISATKRNRASEERRNGIVHPQVLPAPKRARYSDSYQPSQTRYGPPQIPRRSNGNGHHVRSEQPRSEPVQHHSSDEQSFRTSRYGSQRQTNCEEGRSAVPENRRNVAPQTPRRLNSVERQIPTEQERRETVRRQPPLGQTLPARSSDGPGSTNSYERRTTEVSDNPPANNRSRNQVSRSAEGRNPTSEWQPRRKSLQTKTISPTGEYYGIRCGRESFSGVLTAWNSCADFVIGYSDAVYAMFDTWEKAEEFADRDGTGASLKHKSNIRHFFGVGKRGSRIRGSVSRLPWELENEPKVISLVTGAAWGRFGMSAGVGAYSVFFSEYSPYNFTGMMKGHVTEIRLHLRGILEALDIAHQHCLITDGGVIEVYTVSEMVKNGLDHWLGRWDRTGKWSRCGRPVGSQDLWKGILSVREELNKKRTRIHVIWVKGPVNVPAVQKAISLARSSLSNTEGEGGNKEGAPAAMAT